MRYVKARLEKDRREEAYRIYVSEALRILGGLNKSYTELLNYKTETRTAAEIIGGIRDKLNR